jgi:hypothetical protein
MDFNQVMRPETPYKNSRNALFPVMHLIIVVRRRGRSQKRSYPVEHELVTRFSVLMERAHSRPRGRLARCELLDHKNG